MNTLLVCVPLKIPDMQRILRVGDELEFEYGNPHENEPHRVCVFLKWMGSVEKDNLSINTWDHSLSTGPHYHTYNIKHIIPASLRLIREMTPEELEAYLIREEKRHLGIAKQYIDALDRFRKKWFGG